MKCGGCYEEKDELIRTEVPDIYDVLYLCERCKEGAEEE